MVDQAKIHRDVVSVYVKVRKEAVEQLRRNFADLSDKEQAWKDLHRLTEDENGRVRGRAIGGLGNAFPYAPEREQAWKDLYRLTEDGNKYVRRSAIGGLGNAFPYVSDREHAWKDLYRLTEGEDRGVRGRATIALGYVFPHVPDRKLAWKDLYRLTEDKDRSVRLRATIALGHAFPHVYDIEHAWNDLHQLTEAEDQDVRRSAAYALGHAFPYVPNREQAWKDLYRLTEDKDRDVRSRAVYALGHAFPYVPNREQAWKDLYRLTEDNDRDVRVSANHSLGRASIFKAIEVESEKEFRKEIENALSFFERSSKEVSYFNPSKSCLPFHRSFHTITFFERSSKEVSYFNPSKFCLPFYKSFHAITFEGAGADEVQKYFVEAESVLRGSESKEILLKVVENLANALTEAQKAGATDFDVMKSDLRTYRQYCDRAADLIDAAEGGTPGAAQVLRRGKPIIDQRIRELLEEVKKKSESICKVAHLPESELACRIERNAAAALATDNPIIVDQLIDHIIREYEMRISSITNDDDKDYVRRSVIDAKNKDTAGKLLIIISLMGVSPPFSKGGGKEMSKYEIKNSVVNVAEGDRISQSIQSLTNSQKDLNQNNSEVYEPSEESKKNTIPHLSYLESEIYDIFKSVYQKEREEGISEVNSKTLERLKHKLLDLTTSGKKIDWLDVGCGDGRCLEVLDAILNRDNIRYHGIDNIHKYLDEAEERARGYGIDATFDKTNAAVMDFDSEYDVISAVLLLHEVDPLCLPYVLRNMLKALKDDGTLVISDFQGPYEQESDVVVWSAENIEDLLENIGVTWIKTEFIPSKQYPEELGFYRCRVKKPRFANERFNELLQGHDDFLTAKKKESKQERDKLRVQIEERVQELLNRPDIDLKNLSEEEMQRIRNEIESEYGIKAYKVRLLVSQIEFLDDKIEEFNNGTGCAGAD